MDKPGDNPTKAGGDAKLMEAEAYPSISVQYGDLRFTPATPSPDKKNPSTKDRLKGFGDYVSRVRSLFFDIAFLALVAFLITLAVYLALSERKLVIEPIKAPSNLTSLGYSEDVSAHRLMDAILEVEQAAKTRRGNLDVIPQSRKVDITIPEIGTMFDTALYYTKQFLSRQDISVAGEFICSTESCTRDDIFLRLRMLGGRQATINLDTIGRASEAFGAGHYFRHAAIEVLEEVDPYFVAAYFYDRDPQRADNVIRRILRQGGSPTELALAYNLRGSISLHAGDYQTAIARFQRAVETDPELVEAYSNWGNALLAENEIDQAINKYRQAISIDPAFASAYANIGDAHLRRGQIEDSIEYYKQAIALDPDLAYAYANLGDAHARLGDKRAAQGDEAARASAYRTAFVHFRDAIDIQPSLVFAYVSWGNAWMKLEDRDAAFAKFQEALDRAKAGDIPNKAGALAYIYASLGDLHARFKEDPQEVVAAYETALEHRADNLQALVGLGDELFRQQSYDEALDHYQKAIDKKADYIRAHVAMGDAYFRKGADHYEDAAAAYSEALSHRQDAYRAHEGLGNVALRQAKHDAALGHFSNAVRENNQAVHAHAGLGNAHYRLKNYAEAADAYRAALAVRSDIAYIHAGLGNSLLRLQEWGDAAESFNRAIGIAPRSWHVYRSWEEALKRADRRTEVPEILGLWITADPEAAEPHYRLGETLLVLDDPEAAQAAFVTAFELSPNTDDPYHSKARTKLAELGGSPGADSPASP